MDLNFNKNEDHNKLLWSAVDKKLAQIKLGGGKKQLQKLRDQGKMTARERIANLVDPKSKMIEIGACLLYTSPSPRD